eukprot:gene20158-22133_t
MATGRKNYNFINSNEIWKDHIRRETLTQIKCPEKWGFLSDIYKELKQSPDKLSTEESGEMPKNGLPERATAVTKNDAEKKPFPKTSAQMVGWKSSATAKDAYGIPDTRAKGKCDVLRVFQWPHEGL